MNGRTITCGDTVVAVTMVSYTVSLASSVLYTVTLYPVISPLGWVGGFQEMTISSVCILVSGSKVDELPKFAAKSCTGPGSNREEGYTVWGACREEQEREIETEGG